LEILKVTGGSMATIQDKLAGIMSYNVWLP